MVLFKISTDMEENSEMKKDAIDLAQKLLGRNDIKEDDATKDIKSFFDKKYLPNWHCIIGKNFYSSFSHEVKCYIFLYIGQVAVLLYKL
jgi:dynein light chain LC8-type